MNTNQYFLIQKNSNGSATILDGPDYLPESFLNVSNFNNLEQNDPQLLKDLTWLGRPELAFWLANIGIKPTATYSKKIVSETTINVMTETVNVNYIEVDLTPEEQEQKKQNIKNRCTPIRDSYLKLTDFTQLPDAPITDNARIDFAVFRQQLRAMFDIVDYSQLAWPSIPTSAPNISIPPFPPMPSFNG